MNWGKMTYCIKYLHQTLSNRDISVTKPRWTPKHDRMTWVYMEPPKERIVKWQSKWLSSMYQFYLNHEFYCWLTRLLDFDQTKYSNWVLGCFLVLQNLSYFLDMCPIYIPFTESSFTVLCYKKQSFCET